MNLPAGYRARHASLDDIDLVDRLFQEVDRAMVGEAESSAVWIKEDWSSDWVDLATMTRLIFAPGGSVAAYANFEAVDPRVEVGASGRVHPEHVGKGLGTGLVGWTETVAARLIERGASAPLRHSISGADAAARDLLLRAGFERQNS